MKKNIIRSFKNKNVLLVGDTILDIYIYCNLVSQALYDESVPEIEEIRESVSFGGNALVANNILTLGGNVSFVSVVGNDSDADLYNSFEHKKLTKHFFVDNSRKTTVKRRWFVEGKALLQANQVDNHNLSKNLESKVLSLLRREIKKADVVVVMDPQHGFLTKSIVTELVKLSRKNDIPMYVDAQISHRKSRHHEYKGADTFFLNSKEAKAVNPKFSSKTSESSLRTIAKKLRANNIVVKLGEKGFVALFDDVLIKRPAFKVNTVDVCGAGDSFLAAFCLGDKDEREHCLEIANIWAALSTEIHGTIPPKKGDLLKAVKNG